MELFNSRFFSGTLIVAIGLFSLLSGIFTLLPPTEQYFIGIILILVGLPLVFYGYRFAKDAPKPGIKTSIDTLRQTKQLGKTRKK